MRSVAGGFDNECVAVAALCCTFYFWVRSLRSSWSWWLGAITGLSYIYMVAAWGAYTFVLNMIGVHAACMLLLGHFTYGLVFSYSLFYVIGTYGAIQFPIVGMQPFQSMEQLGPLVVLLIMHVFLVVRLLLRAFNPNASKNVVYTTQVHIFMYIYMYDGLSSYCEFAVQRRIKTSSVIVWSRIHELFCNLILTTSVIDLRCTSV